MNKCGQQTQAAQQELDQQNGRERPAEYNSSGVQLPAQTVIGRDQGPDWLREPLQDDRAAVLLTHAVPGNTGVRELRYFTRAKSAFRHRATLPGGSVSVFFNVLSSSKVRSQNRIQEQERVCELTGGVDAGQLTTTMVKESLWQLVRRSSRRAGQSKSVRSPLET